MPNVLLECDEAIRVDLSRAVREAGFEVGSSGDEADVIIVSDVARLSGLALELTGIPVVFAAESIDLTTRLLALTKGAARVLSRPFAKVDVETGLREAMSGRGHPELFGDSVAVRSLVAGIVRVAGGRGPVLLTGEEGTGTEAIARLIHDGRGARGPFEALAGVGSTSAEDRSVALSSRLARGGAGTLFVEAVEGLSPEAQAALLAALSSDSELHVVASSSHGLADAVERGELLGDLAAKLGAPLEVPPLRDRPEDLPALVRRSFFGQSRRLGKTVTLPPSIIPTMQVHRWPGNLVELERMVQALVRSGAEEELASAAHAASDEAPGEGAARYRVPVRREAVLLTFSDGTSAEAHLFCSAGDDLTAVFESSETFVPVEEAGLVRLYARAAIACLYSRTPAPPPVGPHIERRVEVELASGSRVLGELRYSTREERTRAIDHLNEEPKSFCVHSPEGVHYVAKRHVRHVQERP